MTTITMAALAAGASPSPAPATTIAAPSVAPVNLTETVSVLQALVSRGMSNSTVNTVTETLTQQLSSAAPLTQQEAAPLLALTTAALLSSMPNSSETGMQPLTAVAQTAKLGAIVEGISSLFMQSLLLANQSSGLQGGTALGRNQTVVLRTAVADIVAAVVPLPVSQSGATTPIFVPNTPLVGPLPSGAISLALQAQLPGAPAVLGVSSVRYFVNPYGPAASGGESSGQCTSGSCFVQPFGPVITMTISTSSGPVQIQNLPVPMVLALPCSSSQSYEDFERDFINMNVPSCRYWDTVNLRWSSDGCRSIGVDSGGTLRCACTHLTGFGGFNFFLNSAVLSVIQDILDIAEGRVECNYASVLTSEGIQNLVANQWIARAAAGVLFFHMTIVLLLFCATAGLDLRESCRSMAGQVSQAVHSAPSSGNCLLWRELQGMSHLFWLTIRCHRTRELRERAIARSCRSLAAARLGVCRKTLDTLKAYEDALQLGPLDPAATLHGVPAAAIQELHARLVSEGFAADCATSSLCTASAFSRGEKWMVLELIFAFHPLRQLLTKSLHRRHASRALILLQNINCSLFMSALFFTNQGALGADADSSCTTRSEVISQITVSFLTLIAVDGPSKLLTPLDSRGSRGSLISEIGKLAMLFLVSVGLSAFYLLFMASFVANIDARESQRWALTNFCSVVASILFMEPAAWAIGALLLSLADRCISRTRVGAVQDADVALPALAQVLPSSPQLRPQSPVPKAHSRQQGMAWTAGGQPKFAQQQSPAVQVTVVNVVQHFHHHGPDLTARGPAAVTPVTATVTGLDAVDQLLGSLSGTGQPNPAVVVQLPPQQAAAVKGGDLDQLLRDIA